MAITRAQIARELYIKGGVVNPDGRRGFGGGADMGTVSTYDSSTGKGRKAGPGTGGYQGGPKGGYGDAGSDDKPSKEVRDDKKEDYEKQFFDKGKVPPLGGRPTDFKTKLDQRNKQKRLDYVRDLIETRKDKIRKGLIQYQDKLGPITGVADFSTLQDYIDEVQSVKDLVNKGFYSKDGRFADGDIPDFQTTNIPGLAGLVLDKFKGPVTSDRLNELMGEIDTLKGLQTTKGLESDDAKFNTLMETYEPNRFKLMNPEPGGGDNNQTYVPPIIPEDDTTEEDPRQILSTRILGSQFDPTFFANEGGRAELAGGGMPYEGGIMDLESGRQMYFLGKLVKKATRAVKKIAKSPIGKAALMYFGGNALMGKMGGLGGLKGSLFGTAGGTTKMTSGILGKLGLTGGGGSMGLTGLGKAALIGIPSIIPLLAGKEEEDGFDIDAYYAANQLTPGTTKRQMGSEFDFYNYNLAEGGMPSKEPVAKETMPLIDMDGKEMDLRAEGGFVPIGRMEKADDVPARLSKNEFVFTADAVRNAGDGNVDKGAEVMYNMMKNLEAGGDVSEESQGLEGARKMFQTSQRLEEVL